MNTTIDEQFIEYIVKALVGNPEAVSIKRTIDEKGVLLELTVAQEDLGRVIGKRGAGAQALRTLLRALGTKHDARYNLKIVDVGEGYERPERPERKDESQPEAETQQESTSDEPDNEDEVAVEPDTENSAESEDEDDRISKTRRELADLDDLDI